MPEKESIKVLYVDDEEHNLVAFKACFRKLFNVFTAISAIDAVEILSKNDIHVLITDQQMPGALGTELLEKAASENPDQVRILLTGYSDIDALKEAINVGKIYKFLQKPWNEDELIKTIEEAHKIYKIKKDQIKNVELLQLTNEQLEFILRQKLLS